MAGTALGRNSKPPPYGAILLRSSSLSSDGAGGVISGVLLSGHPGLKGNKFSIDVDMLWNQVWNQVRLHQTAQIYAFHRSAGATVYELLMKNTDALAFEPGQLQHPNSMISPLQQSQV